MEVRCSNCATEYEFDDALVSARGTSVKCTQCGHQFRVHARGQSLAPETWVVRRTSGHEVVFNSLRELQQAIVKGALEPQDRLSRGGQPFRPLEDIYELSTFFSAARGARPRHAGTLLGMGAAQQPSAPERAAPERVTPVAPAPARRSFFPPSSDADPGPPPSNAHPPIRHSAELFKGSPVHDGSTQQAPLPWQNLDGLRARDSEAAELSRGGARSRWILAFVVLGGLGLVAVTVGRDYLTKLAPRETTTERRELDQRVPALVSSGRALLDKGDFEGARAELAKASVLSESEPEVAAAVAELELARADLIWIHREIRRAMASVPAASAAASGAPSGAAAASTTAPVRAPSPPSEPVADGESEFQRRLNEQLTKARESTARAEALAQSVLPVVRARVDLLRMSGDPKQARGLVGPLAERASDAPNAYTLGALDYAEGEAGYPSAIARLRVAARNESALGRARAALILALAKTNDHSQALAELDKLRLIAPSHALLADLGALVERIQPPEPAPEPPAAKAAPAPKAEAPAKKPEKPAPVIDRKASMLARAARLRSNGDVYEAEQLYQQVLRSDPANIESLYALGDIARQRRATATATAFFDQVLQHDPEHLPTIMARADMLWLSGRQEEAVPFYRRGLARVGSGHPFGARALSRIEEYERGARPAPSEPPPSEPAPSDDAPTGSGPRQSDPGSGEPTPSPAPPAASGDAPEPPTGTQAGSGT